METKNKTGFAAALVTAMALLVGGIVLMGYFLRQIPADGNVEWWKVVLGGAAAFTPILAGGFWIGALYRGSRRRGDRQSIGNGIVFGIILILIGLFMLSFSAGLFPAQWRPVFISWQMLLIVIGLIDIFKLRFIPGLILVIIGKFFIIPKVARIYPESWLFGENFVSTYWPMLLIAFGILIILAIVLKPRYFRRSDGHRECRERHRQRRRDSRGGGRKMEEARSMDGMVDYNLVFTGAEQVFLDPVFRGGEINAIFAGITLDLRRTTLQEGITYLEISTVLGGATIVAPPEWRIEIRNQSVAGGFSDKRPEPINGIDEADDRKLVIVANCVLGGGELK